MVHFLAGELKKGEEKLFEKHLIECQNCADEKNRINSLLSSIKETEDINPSFSVYLMTKKRIFGQEEKSNSVLDKIVYWLKKPLPAYGVLLIIVLFLIIRSNNFINVAEDKNFQLFVSDTIITDTLKYSTFETDKIKQSGIEQIKFDFKESNINVQNFTPTLNFETVKSEKEKYIIKMLIDRYKKFLIRKNSKGIVLKLSSSGNFT